MSEQSNANASGAAAELTEETVRHVARLSRLKLTDADVHQYFGQLQGILNYVGQLKEVNAEQVEPMAHPLPLHNVLREDVVEPSLPVEQVLANAPGKRGPYFTVPKVLDPSMGGG